MRECCETCGREATHCALDLVETERVHPDVAPWLPGQYRWGCDEHKAQSQLHLLDGTVVKSTRERLNA